MSSTGGGGVRLDSLPRDEVKQLIDSFDNVFTDCDGVLWLFSDTIGDSPAVINRLKAMGKGVYFITNNSSKTRAEFAEKARSLNFNVDSDEIISPAFIVAQYLRSTGFEKEVYVIGSNGIAQELDAVNIRHQGVGPDEDSGGIAKFLGEEFQLDPKVGAVVVGFDEFFNFKKMTRACSYLDRPGCLFLATNTDERFPTPDCVVPGTGALVKAVETAAERKAVVMGKPYPHARDILQEKFSIDPERTLMIGDRCNTDILFGKNCGFKTLMVETGIHKESDVRKWQKSEDAEERRLVPDFILSSLADLLQYFD